MPQVSVIDENGEQLGIMGTFDAIRLAREKGLDLVEVGPTNRPPITKIMDYGKFMYEKGKKQKGQKSKVKSQEVKTMRLGFRTGKHDMEIKAKKVEQFLNKGHLVNIQLMLRGREKVLANLGREKLLNFLNFISVPHQVIRDVKRHFGTWNITIKPEKK